MKESKDRGGGTGGREGNRVIRARGKEGEGGKLHQCNVLTCFSLVQTLSTVEKSRIKKWLFNKGFQSKLAAVRRYSNHIICAHVIYIYMYMYVEV